MKKSFLLFSVTVLLAGSIVGGGKVLAVQANEPTISEQIQALITNIKGVDGLYTKKTTIALNAATVTEMSACFHCNQTASERTTYYKPGQLLLASADGTIPTGSGSYVYADGEVKRAAALEGSTEANMWSNLSEASSVGHNNATKLEDYYVTLDTFLADGYFNGWGENNGVYYYDLTAEDKTKDADSVYNCRVWNDFLYFCAPMLYKNSGQYLSAKSLTLMEKHDFNNNPYLSMTMYLIDEEKAGKLKGGYDYLAEARVYQGNHIFEEQFYPSYYLYGSDVIGEFGVDHTSQNKEVVLKNVQLTKGDAVKIREGADSYHGVSQGYYHNLSSGINENTGFKDANDNYVIPETGLYDFYVKFNDNGTFKELYINDQSARTLYVQDTRNLGGVTIHYWGDNILGAVWDYDPIGVFTGKYDSGHGMFRFVIPGATEKIIIRYDGQQSDDITLDNLNNTYWIGGNGGEKPVGNPYTWSE